VTVVAKQPLFEQKIDRLVINVGASITSSGLTALEVLERSPGVLVNRQDNSVSIAGKSGVVVMINGRINYMTPEAAIQMLNGLSANSIEKIEILSTPPASLDAEGNAGYINIVLKKNENEGWNGSYAATAGYGGSKTGQGAIGNGTLNLNFRKKNLNVYGDYSFSHNGQSTELDETRVITLNGKQIRSAGLTDFRPETNNHNGRIGFDYQVSKKINIGGLVSGYHNRNFWDMEIVTSFSSEGKTDTIIRNLGTQDDKWKHLGGNLNLTYKIREKESLVLGGDFLYYVNQIPNTYDYTWVDGNNTLIRSQLAQSGKRTPIKIAVAKADYSREISARSKFEAGVKFVSSQFDNDVIMEEFNNGAWEVNPEYTSNYRLREQIAAAYSSVEFKVGKKTSAKAGLRYEYTNSNLGSDSLKNIIDRQYGLFFPSFFLAHDLTDLSSLIFSLSRRITRPTFNQLAPFFVFGDPYTIFAGDPAIQPGISFNYKVDYRIRNTLITLQYAHEDSAIVRFQSRVKPGTNIQFNISENLKSLDVLSLTAGSSLTVNNWWKMYVNVAGLRTEVKAWNNGFLNTFILYSATANTTQTFQLPKKHSLEISGTYTSGRLFGIFRVQPVGAVNVAIQKKFEKNNGKLNLGVDNIFNTLIYKYSASLPEQGQEFYRLWQWNQPTVKLSWSATFGNQKMKVEKRNMGNEEERKRVDQ
ncbi:MAG TPA: TonB-dependent receptor, partial [Phnomibacter sp.]|nr:TonB-dependent receptor [Phnomibacter sp.]